MLVAKHVCYDSEIAEQLVGLCVMLGQPCSQNSQCWAPAPPCSSTRTLTPFSLFSYRKIVLVWLHQHSEQLSLPQL